MEPYVPKWTVKAYRCSSPKKPAELVDAARAASEGRNILLVTRYEPGIGGRLGAAYLNTMVRFNDGINKYRMKGIEMLMFLYENPEIGNRKSEQGIENSDFVLFSDSSRLLEKFAKENRIRKRSRIKVIPGFTDTVL